jgi:hypothetical protein
MEGPNCVIIAYLPRQEDSLQAIDIYFVSLIDFNLRKKSNLATVMSQSGFSYHEFWDLIGDR